MLVLLDKIIPRDGPLQWGVDQNCKSAQRKHISSLDSDSTIRTLREINNKSKHFTLTHGRPELVSGAEIKSGYGMGRYGMGTCGVGEPSVIIQFKDGTRRNALHFVEEVFNKLRSALQQDNWTA